MVLPEPTSISDQVSPRLSRKALTAIVTGSLARRPDRRSISDLSTSSTTSNEVPSSPSLTGMISISPMRLVGVLIGPGSTP
jgi:hypothetical protein